MTGVQRKSDLRGGLRRLPLSAWVLVVFAVVGSIGPFLPGIDPLTQDLTSRLRPPAFLDGGTWDHPLGTDQLGRDVLARLVVGCRLSLMIASLSVLLGAAFGTLLGLLAGYRRGPVDIVISRLTETQLVFPSILLAMAIVTSVGRSLPVIVVTLAIIGWAQYARVVRAEVMSLRERPFVRGLEAAGMGPARIMVRHLLPNVLNTILVLGSLQVGHMLLAESAMGFLGIGLAPPATSWGVMLAESRSFLETAPWLAVIPGLLITLVVLSINFFGDRLRHRHDPRSR
ncbi:peptide ABC transporter permease [Acrocarpospora pleiomorpha]|uniref:Peptide ABC transporter permease n=1 Tax=Acrocarpospora pleiomorpha TaxID=90975 RepID=A0A5M3X8C0_9ACTN|nr:ABC transporter permease [Acrocarpospora pleiomorpha]GES17354.1 peptide ABC transporter permease [Acrocarpospora pleiomorpha]